jgi:hypothetical protein
MEPRLQYAHLTTRPKILYKGGRAKKILKNKKNIKRRPDTARTRDLR